MMNAFLGTLLFHSGPVADGRPLTQALEVHELNGVKYMDTPGLSDPWRRKESAQAIDAALTQGGLFRIAFVLELSAGRVASDDLTSMKLVCDAANQIQNNYYAVIFNKCSPKFLRDMLNRDEFIANFKQLLTSKGIPLTDHIHFAPFRHELWDEIDAVVDLDEATNNFLIKMPVLRIHTPSLKKVEYGEWEQVRERMESQLADANAERNALRQQLESVEKQAAADLQKLQQEIQACKTRDVDVYNPAPRATCMPPATSQASFSAAPSSIQMPRVFSQASSPVTASFPHLTSHASPWAAPLGTCIPRVTSFDAMIQEVPLKKHAPHPSSSNTGKTTVESKQDSEEDSDEDSDEESEDDSAEESMVEAPMLPGKHRKRRAKSSMCGSCC